MTGTVLNLGAACQGLDPEMDIVHLGLTPAVMEKNPRMQSVIPFYEANDWAFKSGVRRESGPRELPNLFFLSCLSHSTIKVYASVISSCHVGFGESLFLTILS